MKKSFIILGIILILGLIKCSDDEGNIYIIEKYQEEIPLESAYGTHYFRIPAYPNDNLAIEIKVYHPHQGGVLDVWIKPFAYEPANSEILDGTGYEKIPLGETIQWEEYDLFRYPFSLNDVQYIGFYLYSELNSAIHIHIKSEIGEKVHIIERYLEEITFERAFGTYYFRIPAFQDDNMAIEIKVYHPHPAGVLDVWIKPFKKEPANTEILDGTGYEQIPLGEMIQGEEYDLFRYPFSLNDAQYIGFYLNTDLYSPMHIYIKSEIAEKVALAAGIIALIVIVVVLVVGGIITLILRACGCLCGNKVHSSSIE